jgi:hypothetical protein
MSQLRPVVHAGLKCKRRRAAGGDPRVKSTNAPSHRDPKS